MGRFAAPAEVAQVIRFLVSDDARLRQRRVRHGDGRSLIVCARYDEGA